MSVREFRKVFHIDCLSQIKHVITQLLIERLMKRKQSNKTSLSQHNFFIHSVNITLMIVTNRHGCIVVFDFHLEPNASLSKYEGLWLQYGTMSYLFG
jgi:hypothetical protein